MVASTPGGKQVLVFALVAGLSLLIRLAIGFGSYSGTVPCHAHQHYSVASHLKPVQCFQYSDALPCCRRRNTSQVWGL